jgi:outer membrane protein OmpA-like peptidoglycan-associated protein
VALTFVRLFVAAGLFAAAGATSVHGPWGAERVARALEADLQASLAEAGFGWPQVTIAGDAITMSGIAPSAEASAAAARAVGAALGKTGVAKGFHISFEAVEIAPEEPTAAPVMTDAPSDSVAAAIIIAAAPVLKPAPQGAARTTDPPMQRATRAETATCRRAVDSLSNGRSLRFAQSSVSLSPSEHALLRELARALGNCGPVHVIIEGHADSAGRQSVNDSLSLQRARTVVAALEREGVGAATLHAVGLGDEQPIASNRSAEGRARSRRVDLMISRYNPDTD